jgi:uncharacterized membrane protein
MIHQVFAQEVTVNGMAFKGPLVGYTSIADIINNVVPFVMSLAGILLFFILMWGGFDYVSSQGAPEKLKTANAKITAAVVGFVLLVLSFLITRVLSYVFGVGEGII